MRHYVLLIGAILLAATSIGGDALAATTPPIGGSISLETIVADGHNAPLERSFVTAAGEAFAARGFAILDDAGHAAYVAKLILSREEVGTGTGKPPAESRSVTPGGAFGTVGAGIFVPLPTGKSELVPLQRTRLELRMRKRGEEGVIWHGTAITVRAAGTRHGADDKVASDLSEAILRGYPDEPADVIGVP